MGTVVVQGYGAAGTEPSVRASAGGSWNSLPHLLEIALGFALVGAFGELALLALKRLVFGHAIRMGPQIVWMTPAADALLFLAIALPLAGCARFWRALASTRVAVTVFAFLAALGVLAVQSWRYPPLVGIFALGVAVQTGRLAADDPGRFRRLLRRVLPALVLLVPLMGGGYNLVRHVRERRALAALPAPPAHAPNVLLLIWDTVRASSLGLYGYDRPTTPVLQRLASRGAVFTQAFSTAPWTLPSHAGMFTARYPHELSVGWLRGLDDHYPTLAEVLTRHGYASAGFVANKIYTGYEFGLDRGFLHYDDYDVTPGEFLLASSLLRALSNEQWVRRLAGTSAILGRKTAADVNGELLDWLDHDRPANRPFFVFLNEFDAHEPYMPPPPFDTLFGRLPRWQGWDVVYRTNSAEHEERWKLTPPQVLAERDAYEEAIAYLDSQLGVLLDSLRRRRLLHNTIVVVAADHGEEFGRHGVFTHGNSLYAPVLHVPLVVIAPGGVPANVRVDSPVSLRDLPNTIIDLLDLPATPFPGRSLARFWAPATPGRPVDESLVASEVGRIRSAPDWYPVHPGDLHSIVSGHFHLIRNANGREELYDLRSDPWEQKNLAHDAALASVASRLTAELPSSTRVSAAR